MKEIRILIILLCFAVAVMPSCKKGLDTGYYDVNRIGLSDTSKFATPDSTVFSFSVYPSTTTSHTMTMVALINGQVTAQDRVFTVSPLASSTTALSTEYSLPSTLVIKAGTVSTTIPITVFRTARLTSTNAKLTLQITANNNFQPSPHPAFSIIWNDQLTMPPNWTGTNPVGFYFGTYSKVKHSLLVFSQPLYKDLTSLAGNTPALFYVASAGLDSLNRYNAAHPGNPMKNENGVVIGICSTCN